MIESTRTVASMAFDSSVLHRRVSSHAINKMRWDRLVARRLDSLDCCDWPAGRDGTRRHGKGETGGGTGEWSKLAPLRLAPARVQGWTGSRCKDAPAGGARMHRLAHLSTFYPPSLSTFYPPSLSTSHYVEPRVHTKNHFESLYHFESLNWLILHDSVTLSKYCC